MTCLEAEQFLGLSGRYSQAEVANAHNQKLSEWSTRNNLATTVPGKKQAAEMLKRVKEAQQVLLGGGGTPSSSPKRKARKPIFPGSASRAPSRPNRKPVRPAKKRPPKPRPARTHTVPAPVPVARSTTPPPRASSTPRARKLPWQLKLAAAVLMLGVLLSAFASSSADRPSSRQAPAIINVEQSRSGRRPATVSVGQPTRRRTALGVSPAPRRNTTPPPAIAATPSPTPRRRPRTVIAPPAKAQGFLIVSSFPTAEVFVDGRSVGHSPFKVGEKKTLTVGRHRLVLKNHRFKPLSATIEIKRGHTQEVRGRLDRRTLTVSARR